MNKIKSVWFLRLCSAPINQENHQELESNNENDNNTVIYINISSTPLAEGTLRECMDCAASYVPTYQKHGLTLNSIAQAWETIVNNNLKFHWLDIGSKYFFVVLEQVEEDEYRDVEDYSAIIDSWNPS